MRWFFLLLIASTLRRMALNFKAVSNIGRFHSCGAGFNDNSNLDLKNGEFAAHIVLVYQAIEY